MRSRCIEVEEMAQIVRATGQVAVSKNERLRVSLVDREQEPSNGKRFTKGSTEESLLSCV